MTSPAGPRRRVVMLNMDTRLDARVLLEARTLREAGFDVTVIGANPAPPEVPDDYRADVHVAPGASLAARVGRRLRGAFFAARGSRLTGFEYAFYRAARAVGPDVVHVFDLPLLRVGTALKRALGARLVYDMREFYPEQARLTEEQRTRLRALEAGHIAVADARITVNPLLAEAISESYGGVKVDVLQLAVEAQNGLHEHRHDLFRERFGIGDGRRILLYQGWLGADENLEVLVDGVAAVTAPVDLVFMGYGDLQSELERRADRLGAANRVHFVPAQPRDEFLRYTASADVGVIPYPATRSANQRLASTYKLYEYIAARLPLLVNQLPFIRSVVEENGFGLAADLETAEGCTAAIEQFPFHRLEEFRTNLAARGSAFTWEREEPKLLKIYGNLFARDGGP
jgi:glycosyltransferase involved in cell wall biosynthesis